MTERLFDGHPKFMSVIVRGMSLCLRNEPKLVRTAKRGVTIDVPSIEAPWRFFRFPASHRLQARDLGMTNAVARENARQVVGRTRLAPAR